ncbi:Uncharacterised protein [Serratia fonticola]|uniref:hypothetical protein n=1 Tax=Serratia fonticola TaxID=47917 RepID=UPI00217707A6|nr:hypothetical protein [Serratia fonticola]CAI0999670.1 Uncharacterised protein [Serratia fonticola]
MNKIKLFAILDIDHPMVAWEVAIGRVLAYPEMFEANIPSPSLWLFNNIKDLSSSSLINDLLIEFEMESYRRKHVPGAQSRLSGAFFFESMNDAKTACEYWGWFDKIDYISEVDFYPVSIFRADSNWITNKIRSCEKNERMEYVERYFSGEESQAKPIYEVISEGYGYVLNEKLRREAYKKIRERTPYSSFLLALGISAFSQSEKYRSIFRVLPFLREINNEILGDFIIDMKTFNENEAEVARISKRHIHNNATILSHPKLDICGKSLLINRNPLDDVIFNAPDLRTESFIIDSHKVKALFEV